MSGNNDCNEFRFPNVMIVITFSNVTFLVKNVKRNIARIASAVHAPIRSRIQDLVPNGTKFSIWSQKVPILLRSPKFISFSQVFSVFVRVSTRDGHFCTKCEVYTLFKVIFVSLTAF